MDDLHQLIHRNGQLEAELRLVKEQLCQAHACMQYLLKQVCNQEGPQRKCDEAVLENARLETQLGTRDGKAKVSQDRPIDQRGEEQETWEDLLDFGEDLYSEQDSMIDALSKDSGGELIKLIDEHPPKFPLVLRPREVKPNEPCKQEVKPRSPRKNSIGLGINALIPANSTIPHSSTRGFYVYDGEGDRSFIPIPHITPNASGTFSPTSLPFYDGEHRKLAGEACFLEDQTEEERDRLWVWKAKESPRHSAEEWKEYYEAFVRPAYVKRYPPKVAEDGEGEGSPGTSKAVPLTGTPRWSSNSSCSESAVLLVSPEEGKSAEDGNDEASGLENGETARDPEHDGKLILKRSSSSRHALNEPEEGGQTRSPSDHEDVPAARNSSKTVLTPICPVSELSLHAKVEPNDPHAYRTILISNLAPVLTLAEVLDNIHIPCPWSAKIFSAQLVKTTGMRTTPPIETNSALVVFTSGPAARAVVEHYHSLCSTQKTCDTPTFTLLPTITRPLPVWTVQKIRDIDLSRVLMIHFTQPQHRHWTLETVEVQLLDQFNIMKRYWSKKGERCMVFEFAKMVEAKNGGDVVGRFFGDEVERKFGVEPAAAAMDWEDRTYYETLREAELLLEDLESEDGGEDEKEKNKKKQVEMERDIERDMAHELLGVSEVE